MEGEDYLSNLPAGDARGFDLGHKCEQLWLQPGCVTPEARPWEGWCVRGSSGHWGCPVTHGACGWGRALLVVSGHVAPVTTDVTFPQSVPCTLRKRCCRSCTGWAQTVTWW